MGDAKGNRASKRTREQSSLAKYSMPATPAQLDPIRAYRASAADMKAAFEGATMTLGVLRGPTAAVSRAARKTTEHARGTLAGLVEDIGTHSTALGLAMGVITDELGADNARVQDAAKAVDGILTACQGIVSDAVTECAEIETSHKRMRELMVRCVNLVEMQLPLHMESSGHLAPVVPAVPGYATMLTKTTLKNRAVRGMTTPEIRKAATPAGDEEEAVARAVFHGMASTLGVAHDVLATPDSVRAAREGGGPDAPPA